MIKRKLTSAKLVKWGFERPLDSTESSMYSLCSRDLPMLAETCRTLPAIVYHSIRSQLSNSFEVSSKYFVAKFVSKLSVSKLRKNLRVFITREKWNDIRWMNFRNYVGWPKSEIECIPSIYTDEQFRDVLHMVAVNATFATVYQPGGNYSALLHLIALID